MVFVSMALAGAIVATTEWSVDQSNRQEIVAFGRAVMLQVTNVYALEDGGGVDDLAGDHLEAVGSGAALVGVNDVRRSAVPAGGRRSLSF